MTTSLPPSANRPDSDGGRSSTPYAPPRQAADNKPADSLDAVLLGDAPTYALTSANFSSLGSSSPFASAGFLSVSPSSRPRANTANPSSSSSSPPPPPLVGPEILRPATRTGPVSLPPPPPPPPSTAMYQTGQRDPSRPFQVPPPPPPMSPPLQGLANGMMIPPPPPRYPSTPGAGGPVMLGPAGLPPPPGPPPASAMGQQAPWHGTWGRMYDGRGPYIPPPPPATAQHQAYNPKLHAAAAAAAAGQTITIPPPPPPSEQMSATYIPQGDTYGEGVGIPGLGGILDDVATFSATTQSSWGHTSDSTLANTPLDDPSSRDRMYPGTINARGQSTTSNAATSGIPSELAAQWPLDKVLLWLQTNNFSRDWQETFKGLNLHGTQFLELGSGHGGRGNFGMMHQRVYPRLAQECTNSKSGWDQPREREEGKRMRRLIRGLVLGRTTDLAKMSTSHARNESASAANVLPSAGTDPGASPDVSRLTIRKRERERETLLTAMAHRRP